MIKKLTLICVMSFIMLFTVDVHAGEYWNARINIEKGEDSGELYNYMPTPIKKGDIVSVKLIADEVQGWQIIRGGNTISWDKEVFELIEENGEYYRILDNNVKSVGVHFNINSSLYVSYEFDNYTPDINKLYLIELRFRVKNNIKDGVYEISIADSHNLVVRVDDRDEYVDTYYNILKYQLGKPKLISPFTKDSIGNSSYIIGNYLFTREKNDDYNGALTTEYIMLASKSINSDNKDDMIIYFKNAKGEWINAITNEAITPPNEFDIENNNMQSVYKENGVYASNNYNTIVRVIQINENEAIVRIDTDVSIIEGIATVNGKTVTLSVKGKTYTITLNDDEIILRSTDSNISSSILAKKANVSVIDYFNDSFSNMSDNGSPTYYLQSGHTGRYTRGNYELYLIRTDSDYARVCIREIGETECIFNKDVYDNKYGLMVMGEETTYAFSSEEIDYGFDWNNNEIEVKCSGFCDGNPYVGKYTKASSITMDEAFHVWEQKSVLYRFVFDMNNGEEPNIIYVPAGESINSSDGGYYIDMHHKDGHEFVEWQLNGVAYDFDTPVTGPVTVVARYNAIPKHNVVFSTGTSTTQVEVTHGSTVQRPADPTQDRYIFIEWQLNGSTYDFSTPVNESITLTALWGSFDGVYTLDDQTIKLYSLYDGIIRGFTTGHDINGILNTRISNNGTIALELGNSEHPIATYNIALNNGNIVITSDGDVIPTGEYTRVSDYTTEEFYEDYYNANADYLEDETYNKIATIAQTNGILTLYMFKTDANEVTVYIRDANQTYLYRERMTIENDGSLSLRGTDNKLVLTITINSNNIDVAKYNDAGTEIDTDAYITGTYTAQRAITVEDIVGNVG